MRERHPYVAGFAFIVVGIFGLIGSVTGRLAPMLAALFDSADISGA